MNDPNDWEVPLLETKPPFVIKIFKTYFHISEDGNSQLQEDNFLYEKIRSVEIKKNKLRASSEEKTGMLLVDLLFRTHTWDGNRETEELVIEFKTGETETRYFNGVSAATCAEAVEWIKNKIKHS